MKELLDDFGEVEIEREIAGEVRTIDVVFIPNPAQRSNLKPLGLLGQMIDTPCAMEAFRNAVPEWEVGNCRVKLFELVQELNRRAKKKKTIQGDRSSVSMDFDPDLFRSAIQLQDDRICYSLISDRRFRHRSEQYFTSSQHFSHFLRQVKGNPQTTQVLLGKSDFLR